MAPLAVTAAVTKPTVMKMDKRASQDTERVKRAFQKLKVASKEKRERLVADLTSALEVIDRVAKDEIEFLQVVFNDTDDTVSGTTTVEFEELDGIVVFDDDTKK